MKKFMVRPKYAILLFTPLLLMACPSEQTSEVSISKTTLEPGSIEMSEPAPTATEIGYYPLLGQTVLSNPPALHWMPVSRARAYTVQIASDKSFSAVQYEQSGIERNVHRPSQALEPGEWYWRYAALDLNGNPSEWSQTRSFTISQDAHEFAVPPLATQLENIPESHPRLLFTKETLASYRDQFRRNTPKLWMLLLQTADGMAQIEVPASEPPALHDLTRDDSTAEHLNMNRVTQHQIKEACERAANLAFVSVMTDDNAYTEAATAWIQAVASWPAGEQTSFEQNPEMSPYIVSRLSRAYTWMHESLSNEIRTQVAGNVAIRCREIYNYFIRNRATVIPRHTYIQPAMRALAEAAVAFHGTTVESEDWFKFAMNWYYTLYPVWGGEDGGWHQGLARWNQDMNETLDWLNMMHPLGLNLREHPYFQTAGDFPLYTCPPGLEAAPFTASEETITAKDLSHTMSRLAAIANEPYWWWYAHQAVPEPYTRVTYQELFSTEVPDFEPKKPEGIAQSKVFAQSGFAALHNNYGDTPNDIQFTFKSSPLGTGGYGLQAQNAFELSAYGKAYAVSSGVFEGFSSPHVQDWMQIPSASNIITTEELSAIEPEQSVGGITAHYSTGGFDYLRGDASNAYGDQLSTNKRHVFFIKPGTIILLDEVEAPEPRTFQYNLHTPHTLGANTQDRLLLVSEPSGVRISLVTPVSLNLNKSESFEPAPLGETPAQQHLAASIPEPLQQTYFISVIQPDPRGILPVLDMSYISGKASGVGFEMYGFVTRDNKTSLILNQSGETFTAMGGRLTTNARVILLTRNTRDEDHSFGFVSEATTLSIEGNNLLESEERGIRYINATELAGIMQAAAGN